MIVTAALALDNGFRVIVVFTSNYVKLVEQTVARFRVLEGPLIYSSTEAGASGYLWQSDLQNIRRNIGDKGLVVICAKDANHQRALLDLLQESGASNFPALIVDDEADQATPDTTVAARAGQRASAPAHGSVTYRLVVENDADAELGESTRELLRHNLFLQVTATPYALLLQNIDSPLRPKFTRLLEPGEGYTGGEHFFSTEQVRGRRPPLAFVDEQESSVLSSEEEDIPQGLARAVAFFLLSATAHSHVQSFRDPEGHKFLCHTSPKTTEHERAGHVIRTFVDQLLEDFDRGLGNHRAELFDWAHRELSRSAPIPSLTDLIEKIRHRLHRRRVLIINSASARADFGPTYNFLVGGNILGRGLTIDHLLVTYYLRRAQTTQMDTMLQHARMYGYRAPLMPFTRVFLPESLAIRFHRIHETETTLRDLLRGPMSDRIPVRAAGDLRPTRRGVLDPGTLCAYRPGQQVYPSQPAFRAADLGSTTERIDQILRERFGDPPPLKEFLEVDFDFICDMIDTVRSLDEERGDWDRLAIRTVLDSMRDDYHNSGALYVREFQAERGPILSTGAISGDEHNRARDVGRPVLFLFREPGRSAAWAGLPFWYPTLVFPKNMPMQVFNASE